MRGEPARDGQHRRHLLQAADGIAPVNSRATATRVPGREDPRTGMRGHTIHWNLKSHVHIERTSSSARLGLRTHAHRGALTGYCASGRAVQWPPRSRSTCPSASSTSSEVQGGRLNTGLSLPELWLQSAAGRRRHFPTSVRRCRHQHYVNSTRRSAPTRGMRRSAGDTRM